MRRRTVAFLSATAAIALAASAGATTHAGGAGSVPLPGYWRYDTSFLFSNDSDMKCIGPADIDKVLQGPSNRHYDCTYPVREIAGGKARFEGVCVNRKNGQKAEVSLQGSYSPTAFAFNGVVRAEFGKLSLPLNASISAQRVAATCPAS